MFDDNKKKAKLNRQQTKKLLPALKAFNKMAESFISLMNKKIQEKENKLNQVRHLVSNSRYSSMNNSNHNISIQTLDINKTMVRKKGSGSYNQKMDWEKDLRKRNRGIML